MLGLKGDYFFLRLLRDREVRGRGAEVASLGALAATAVAPSLAARRAAIRRFNAMIAGCRSLSCASTHGAMKMDE